LRSVTRKVCVVFSVFLAIFLISTNSSLAYTVSGTIYGGGSPQANATVVLTKSADSSQVGSMQTAANGTYSFASVGAGSYNLAVSPPASSVYGASPINAIAVTGSDLTQDVVLMQNFSISGTVRGAGGVAASNIQVSLYHQGGSYVASSTSDANGAYSFGTLTAGTYQVNVTGGYYNIGASSTVPTPYGFTVSPIASGIIVAGATTQDITLPSFSTLSGRTLDNNGAAVAGVNLYVANASWTVNGVSYSCRNDVPTSSYYASYQVNSDASGNYSVLLLPYSSYVATLTPPSANKTVLTTTVNPLDASATATRDLMLTPAYGLSGTVRGAGGAAASNIQVSLYHQGGSYVASSTSDANGAYSFSSLTAGTYQVNVTGGYYNIGASSTVPTPYGFTVSPIATGIIVAGATTQDITLPSFSTLSGRTLDNSGSAVAGVNLYVANASWTANGVSYSCRNDVPTSSYYASYQVNSDVSGNYSMLLLPYSSYVATLTPPSANKTVLTTTVNPLDASATATRDLKLTPAYGISGTVRGAGGAAASNIQVALYHQGGSYVASSTSDANGAYSFSSLTAGTYQVNVTGGYYNIGASSTVPTPYGFTVSPIATGIIVAGATTQDITLPSFSTLSGRTLDNSGSAVAGVNLYVANASWTANGVSYSCRNDVPTSSYYASYQVNSDVSGNYSMLLLPYSSYVATLTPPSANKTVLTTTVNPLDASATATRDLKLTPAYGISGTVRGAGGAAASNIQVALYHQGGSYVASSTSDANGAYSFSSLTAGTYQVNVTGGYYNIGASSTVPTPYGFTVSPIATGIIVAGATTQDITLPSFSTLSGRTLDNSGSAVAGVNLYVANASWTANGVSYSCRNDVPTSSYYASYQVNSDVSGNYSMLLLPYSSYVATLTPPSANKTVLTTTVNPLDASATATRDLKLTPAYGISGTVRGAGGAAASNIQVALYHQGGSYVASSTSDANGAYSFSSLTAGTYQVNVTGGYYNIGASSTVPTPYGFTVSPIATGIIVAGPVTQDITLPSFNTLSGKTTDNNGSAVAGVNLYVANASWTANGVSYSCRNDVPTSSYYASYQVNSDASGNYSMLLLPYGGYSMTITPPTNSKFIPVTIAPFSVTQNTLNNITLIKSVASYKLSATVIGTNGNLTSSPTGINCSSGTCSWYFDTGTQVDLTASQTGFIGWTGACTGKGTCTVTLSADTAVTANYLDTTPPALSLSTLADASVTNNATLNVAGAATDAGGIATVSVNGSAVTLDAGGHFSYALTLAAGANTVTVVATDNAGNQSTDTRTITLDQTAPALTVAAPADNSAVKSTAIALSGTVDETSTVSFSVNGGPAQNAALDGQSFTATANLAANQVNTINITATDLAGNTTTVKRTVTSDQTAPSLALTNPAQDTSTTQNSYTISGTIADTLGAASVTVSVGGYSYSPAVSNGSFSQTVTFPSAQTYTVTATGTDQAGNQAVVTRNIIYNGPTITSSTLTLGTASGRKGSTVTVPITLTNLPGDQIATVTIDIGYDATQLGTPSVLPGAAGTAAGKTLQGSITSAGVFRVGLFDTGNAVIGNGVVASVSFTVAPTDSIGASLALSSSPAASDPLGNAVPVSGAPGAVTVVALPGDCNGDNSLSPGEFTSAINSLMGRSPGSNCAGYYGGTTMSPGYFTKIINAFMGR